MDTIKAFAKNEEAIRAGAKLRVFDWDRAAQIITLNKDVRYAEAGLQEDWDWTGGEIIVDGKPVAERDGHYLASLWATPILRTANGEIECWRYEDDTPGWGPETFWPESAKRILAEDAS